VTGRARRAGGLKRLRICAASVPSMRRRSGGRDLLVSGHFATGAVFSQRRGRRSARRRVRLLSSIFLIDFDVDPISSAGFTHPSSLEEIERELMSIGAERFRTNGSFDLPSGTRQRILATQERTRKQQDQHQVSQATKTRSRSKLAGQEKAAAASLLGLRRGASFLFLPSSQTLTDVPFYSICRQ
jgi:hypothetical protein